MNILRYVITKESTSNIKLSRETLHYLMMKELISHMKLERSRSFLL
jgi:hypothetical protein